jgi:hypothetical protein
LSSDADTAWKIVQEFDGRLGQIARRDGTDQVFKALKPEYDRLRANIEGALAAKDKVTWPVKQEPVPMKEPAPPAWLQKQPISIPQMQVVEEKKSHQPNFKRPSKEELVQVLNEEGMIKSAAAVRFGVSLTSIKRWLQHYGIDYPQYPGEDDASTPEVEEKGLLPGSPEQELP